MQTDVASDLQRALKGECAGVQSNIARYGSGASKRHGAVGQIQVGSQIQRPVDIHLGAVGQNHVPVHHGQVGGDRRAFGHIQRTIIHVKRISGHSAAGRYKTVLQGQCAISASWQHIRRR